MLKKDDPFVEGFRKWEGLHGPEEVASSSGETTLEPPSFEDAVMSFTQPNQIADEENDQLAKPGGTPRQWTTLTSVEREHEHCES